jgi:tetratricopeptide (TPR) repeat protein
VLLVGTGLAAALKLALRSRQPAGRSVATSAGAALLGLALAGLTDVDAVTSLGMVLLTFPLGLLAAGSGRGDAETRGRGEGRRLKSALGGRGCPSDTQLTLVTDHGLKPVAWRGALSLSRSLALSLFAAVLLAGLALAGHRVEVNLGAIELARSGLRPVETDEARRQHAAAALGHLRRAVERAPDDPRAQRGLVAALARTDRDAGRDALPRLAELTPPDDSRALFQLGRLARELGQVQPALEAWSRVDPSLGVWNAAGVDYHLVAWGAELVRAGRWADAVAVNGVAIEATPTNPAPWIALGLALPRAVGPAAAEAALEELAGRHPTVPWASFELMRFYERHGQWGSAITWRDRGRAVRGSSEWREQETRASLSYRYHRMFRYQQPGRTPGQPASPTINDGVSLDGGALLMTNTTAEVRSYSFQVEFKRGGQVIGLARGVAEQVRPGERRAVSLAPRPTNLAVESYAAVVRFSSQVEAAGPRARAAETIRFAETSELIDLGLDVQVVNGDTAAHTLVIQASLGRDGKLVYLLSGPPIALAPGERRTVTLLADRPLPRYNQVQPAVEQVLE